MTASRWSTMLTVALATAVAAAAGAWGLGLVAVRQAARLDALNHEGAVEECRGAFDDLKLSLEGRGRVTVLDAAGDVVSSNVWPERVGLPAPELAGLEAGRTQVVEVRTPGGARLELVVRRLTEAGGSIVQGIPLASIVLGRRCRTVESAQAQPREPASTLATSVPLPGGRASLLVTSERRAELAAGRLVFRRTLAATAVAAAAGLGVGWWLARRSERPFERLGDAVRRIAEGRADYGFAASDLDAVDETAQLVSSLERALERQRRRSAAAERVAAWREVARHVSHEVNNPLVPIKLTVDNLRRARRDGARFDEVFEKGTRTIQEEVEQLQRLVEEFSEFARLPAPELRPVDIVGLVSGVAALYESEPGLELVLHIGEAIPVVSGDSSQLSRVLKNVVGNAVEAMREGRERALEIGVAAIGGAVRIRVDDSGPGLPEGGGHRLFEAGFSTKNRGSGLGMAIVDRIVAEHGGTVQAENRPDSRGARVEIELPAAAAFGRTS